MYKILPLFCYYFVFVGIAAAQQPVQKELKINFDFNSSKEVPIKIFIQATDLGRNRTLSDTLLIANEFNHYSIKVAEPAYFTLGFLWKNKVFTSLQFWASDGKGDIKFLNGLRPVISLENNEFPNEIDRLEKRVAAYQQASDDLVSSISYENRKVSDVESQISEVRDSMEKAIDREIYYPSIKENLNSPVGLYSLWRYADRPLGRSRLKVFPTRIDSLIHQLDLTIQALPSAVKLKSNLQLEGGQTVGKQMKDISLLDSLGKPHKISAFLGKYVLIDFWASWCSPCRAEHPNLNSAYKKYQSLGFEIISVTRDNKNRRPEWLEAIKQDNIGSWLHLSDFNNIAQAAYNIEEIPVNFLIDPQGKIIAKNLRGTELSDELRKIFEK